MNRIFARAIDGDSISTREAKALVLVIDECRFERGAKKHLIEKLKKNAAKEALRDGSGNLLITDNELSKLNSALLRYTKKISFRSPGTKLRYRPAHYSVIKKLVADLEIFVYEVKDAGLYKKTKSGRGLYSSSRDELFLVAGMSAKGYAALTVHEAAHAIQDWQDIKSTVKFIEADAYVAQGVANHAVGARMSASDQDTKPWQAAFHGASKLVVEDKDKSDSQEWIDAYHNVVDAVEKNSIYGHKHSHKRKYDEKGTDERKRFRSILRRLSKKKK